MSRTCICCLWVASLEVCRPRFCSRRLSRGWSRSIASEDSRRVGWPAHSASLPGGMASAPLWLAFWRKLLQVGFINCDVLVFRFIFTLATFFFFCPDVAGDIGPFQLAIVLTALCLVPIFFWRENYGSSEEGESDGTESSPPQSMMASLRASAKLIWAQPVVLFLGLSQACFEGAVFTFGKQPACFIFSILHHSRNRSKHYFLSWY